MPGNRRSDKGDHDEKGATARWHEGRSENRRETAKRDRKRRTPKGGRRIAHHTPLLKIPVWWRRAVLPSLPWVLCFVSFFLFDISPRRLHAAIAYSLSRPISLLLHPPAPLWRCRSQPSTPHSFTVNETRIKVRLYRVFLWQHSHQHTTRTTTSTPVTTLARTHHTTHNAPVHKCTST